MTSIKQLQEEDDRPSTEGRDDSTNAVAVALGVGEEDSVVLALRKYAGRNYDNNPVTRRVMGMLPIKESQHDVPSAFEWVTWPADLIAGYHILRIKEVGKRIPLLALLIRTMTYGEMMEVMKAIEGNIEEGNPDVAAASWYKWSENKLE